VEPPPTWPLTNQSIIKSINQSINVFVFLFLLLSTHPFTHSLKSLPLLAIFFSFSFFSFLFIHHSILIPKTKLKGSNWYPSPS